MNDGGPILMAFGRNWYFNGLLRSTLSKILLQKFPHNGNEPSNFYTRKMALNGAI